MFQSTSESPETSPAAPGTSAAAGAGLLRLWIAALAVAILGGAVVFEQLPGLNWAMLAAAATAAFAWIRVRSRVPTPWPVWRSILLADLLAASVAVTGDGFLHLLVLLGVAVLAAHVVLACAFDELQPPDPLRLALAPLRAALPLFRELHARLESSLACIGAANSLPAVRGVAIAMPVALAFFLLLAGADATFGYWRDTAWASLLDLSALPRLAFTGVLLVLMLAALGLAAHPAPDGARRTAGPPRARYADVERAIVLAPVALLFTAFLLLRLPELFADAGARPGSGITYAQSVHKASCR